MDEKASVTRDHRRALLGVGVICLGAAAAVVWWQGQPETASVVLRAGILLAAVWLAYPSLRSTRWGTLLAVIGGGVLLLTRWRLVAAMVLGVLAVLLAWGRIKRRGKPFK